MLLTYDRYHENEYKSKHANIEERDLASFSDSWTFLQVS